MPSNIFDQFIDSQPIHVPNIVVAIFSLLNISHRPAWIIRDKRWEMVGKMGKVIYHIDIYLIAIAMIP
jgi:hypothetical protein